MGFKVGLALGCAVGVLAAVKAAELRRLGVGAELGQRRKKPVPQATAARVRAVGDLARERVVSMLEGPSQEAALDRVTSLLGSSLGHADGSFSHPRRSRAAVG